MRISITLLGLLLSSALAQNPANLSTRSADSAPRTPAPQFIHPPGDFATVNGVKLWYESEGSGPPLLLIAGGPGLPHGYLHPHFSQLAKSYRVIYFDAYGTGKSDQASDPHDYTFARDVENIEGLRLALGLGKINVLGHSYGGMVAQAYALQFPDSVQKLVLVDTAWGAEMAQAHMENQHNELRNQYPETWEKFQKAHDQGFHTCSKEYQEAADETREFSASMLFYDTSKIAQLVATGGPPNRKVTCAMRGDDSGFVLGGDLAKLDFRPRLKDLHMPTLILAGRFDRILFPRYQIQFKTYAPQAQFLFFEKSGHFPFIEEPEEFTRVVSEFLRKEN
jgi:proline iminopeptidase